MANLKLTLACWDYDRTRALFDGRVRPEGIELELWSSYNVGEIMERMLRQRQFDVSELGITYYLRSLELMDAPFRGDTHFGADLPGLGTADAMNIGQRYKHALLRRNIDASYTSHVVSSSNFSKTC